MKSLKIAIYSSIVLHVLRNLTARLLTSPAQAPSSIRIRQVLSMLSGDGLIPALRFENMNLQKSYLVPISFDNTDVPTCCIDSAMKAAGYSFDTAIPGTPVECLGIYKVSRNDPRIKNYLDNNASVPGLPSNVKMDYLGAAYVALAELTTKLKNSKK